jgi:hypothetical protein
LALVPVLMQMRTQRLTAEQQEPPKHSRMLRP